MFPCDVRSGLVRRIFLALMMAAVLLPSVLGQTGDSPQEIKRQALALINQQKLAQSLPLLEKLAILTPSDPEVHYHLGFALIGQANVVNDSAQRKALRARSRSEFVRAKELGSKEANLDAMIQGMPADGSDAHAFSQNREANDAMNAAEAFFSQGRLDDAFAGYQKALQLDPKLYEAATFAGDVRSQQGNAEQAEIWFQKAIAIDPNRETAYRYSATPLMRQGKYEQARDRYIDAVIAQPYSKFAQSGLTSWGKSTKTTLAHPAIDIPELSFDENGNVTNNLGTGAWSAYATRRSQWRKDRFKAAFPNEKTYRHSLAEEADALRAAVTMAVMDRTVSSNPSLAKLKQLNDAGLLEAYILLVKSDQGIGADYPAYRQQNKDKLRRYLLEYYVGGAGR